MDFYNWISQNYIEIAGAVTGIIYVFLEIRQTIWLWPFGIVTSALYIVVFFLTRFYADAGLQVYYLIISVYGWYWWVRGVGQKEEPSFAEATEGEESEERKAESEKLIGEDPLPGGVWGGFLGTEHGAQGSEQEEEPSFAEATEGEESEERRAESGEKGELQITRLLFKTGLLLSVVFAVLFAVMWYILDNFTDSPVPGWDSFLTALSIIATWMLARKILEHWIIWIVVDIVSMFVYFTKGLYPTVILFGVYSTMAFVGYFEWKKGVRAQGTELRARGKKSGECKA